MRHIEHQISLGTPDLPYVPGTATFFFFVLVGDEASKFCFNKMHCTLEERMEALGSHMRLLIAGAAQVIGEDGHIKSGRS